MIEIDGSASITVKGIIGENDRATSCPPQLLSAQACSRAEGSDAGPAFATETARPCRMELTKLAPQSPGQIRVKLISEAGHESATRKRRCCRQIRAEGNLGRPAAE